ncbi:MAG TPA: rhomboid family intramembrane serine protease [Polyangia bacterium]|nr:rhomboid family intramembrane serine protease [Polyangia bacterium]
MSDLPRRRGTSTSSNTSSGPSWIQPFAARLTPAIKAILVVNVLLYLVFLLVHEVRELMLVKLSVSPDLLHAPWQPLTAMFLHIENDGRELLFLLLDLLGIWFVGGSLERKLGTKRFLILFLGAGVLANVAIALVSGVFGAKSIYIGPSLAILGLFVAFARVWGPVPTQVIPGLAFKATHTAIFFVAIAILMSLGRRDLAAVAGAVVAAAAGWLLAAPGGVRQVMHALRLRAGRQRYKVLDGGAPPRRVTRSQKYWN